MGSRRFFTRHPIAIPAFLILAAAAIAVAAADDADPPGRVARLSDAEGSVSLQPAGVQDWAPATLNRPLTTGDKLWTDQDSRAELDIGSAAIRLGSTTGFSFLNLDDRMAQMNVTAGTAIVHVRDMSQNQGFEIDTPNIALTLQGPGDYRVEVNESGDTTIVEVSSGQAEASATGQTIPIGTQQAVTFTGTDQVTADAASVGAPDALDQWSLDREHQQEAAQAQASQYVSPEVEGGGQLGQYGSWNSVPEYGNVWTPNDVGPDWAPYQDGRWVWVSPWGWTWVDNAPWGFAPFHYGRWAHVYGHWCWVPGPRHVRPVYAPALVAWVHSPGGIATTIAVGAGAAAVAWFALGPREVYVPGYHVSPAYVRNVNVSNTTIVNNTYITNVYENKVTNITYVNQRAPGAVTAVSQSTFTSAQPIRGHTVQIPPNEVGRLRPGGAAPAIAPERQSLLGHTGDGEVRHPPAAYSNRPVVARVAPPAPPVPFAKQQAAIRANGDRPLARTQLATMQERVPASRVRVVKPGPVRNLPVRSTPAPTLQERERALQASPIPPAKNAMRNDRPPGAQRSAAPEQSKSTREHDRPGGEMRQNDMLRAPGQRPAPAARPMQVNPTPEAHPAPQAHPLPQERPEARPMPQARPAPPARPIPQARPLPEAHPLPQEHAVEPPPPRAAPPPEPRALAPRQPQPESRFEAPRGGPVAYPVAPPPRPAAPARPAPPPARPDQRPNKPDRPNYHQ